jgi:mannonate dehydratase
MQMGFRWYGEGNDQISLNYIKQIPGVSTIVWALHHKMPGEIWTEEEIAAELESMAKQYEMEVEKIKDMVPAEELKVSLETRKAVKVIVDAAKAIAPKAKEETKE